MTTTKINIKPHLAEYCYGKFSGCSRDPVRFPHQLEIYHSIWDLMQKRPVNCPVDTGNLEIFLPYSSKKDDNKKRKDPHIYNYISERAAKIIARKIEISMFAELHELLDENKYGFGIDFKETVFLFMSRYAIDSITEDALIKNFYRWRNMVRKRRQRRKYSKNVREQV